LPKKPPSKFVLHTTGGDNKRGANFVNHGLTTLTRNGYWPHFQVGRESSMDMKAKIRVVQYIPVDMFCYAMEWGGDSIQVEISATATQHFTDDKELAAVVAALYRRMREVFPSIANAAPMPFKANTKRADQKTWDGLSGLMGHLHCGAANHGDPGTIDASVLLDAPAGTADPKVKLHK